MKLLDTLLHKFQNYTNSSLYTWHWIHQGGLFDFQLQINGLIHGNETGSLPAILKIIEEIQPHILENKIYLYGDILDKKEIDLYADSIRNMSSFGEVGACKEVKRRRKL